MRFTEAGRRLELAYKIATAARERRRARRPAFLWMCLGLGRDTLLLTKSRREITAGIVPFDLSLDRTPTAPPVNDRLHVIFPDPTPADRLDIAVRDVIAELEEAGAFDNAVRPRESGDPLAARS